MGTLGSWTTDICATCFGLGHTAHRCLRTHPELRPSAEELKAIREKQMLKSLTTAICSTCLEFGHTSDHCWKTHPELRPSEEELKATREKQMLKSLTTAICSTCLKFGHTSDRCWKTHPELKSSKGDTPATTELRRFECEFCGRLDHRVEGCWEKYPHLRLRIRGKKGKKRGKACKHFSQDPDPSFLSTTTSALLSYPQLNQPAPAFDLGPNGSNDPAGVRFPEDINYWFDFCRERLPTRFVICLALNEVGRRLKQGFVFWTGGICDEDTWVGKFELMYLGKEWSEEDCEVFDERSHEERLKKSSAHRWLEWDEKVVPIDAQSKKMAEWVQEEGAEDDPSPLQAELTGVFLTYARTGGAGISGVPYLSSLKAWAERGGMFEKGINLAKGTDSMAMARKKDNFDVMYALQKMWESGEKGVVIVHDDVEGVAKDD